MSAHITLALLEPSFALAAWWQVNRALGGNDLSWLYVFEWPFFGVYAVFLWWRIVHGQLRPVGGEGGDGATADDRRPWWVELGGPARAERRAARARLKAAEEAAALASYNRHLAALASEEDAKRSSAHPAAGD